MDDKYRKLYDFFNNGYDKYRKHYDYCRYHTIKKTLKINKYICDDICRNFTIYFIKGTTNIVNFMIDVVTKHLKKLLKLKSIYVMRYVENIRFIS